jgi:hypothetical protein
MSYNIKQGATAAPRGAMDVLASLENFAAGSSPSGVMPGAAVAPG